MGEKQQSSAPEEIIRGAEAANRVRAAIKTGKAVAGAAKGAAVGGPYGAAAVAIWQNKETIGKIALAMGLVLLIPILFILMLPSMIFGGLAQTSEVPVMNNDAAIHSILRPRKARSVRFIKKPTTVYWLRSIRLSHNFLKDPSTKL